MYIYVTGVQLLYVCNLYSKALTDRTDSGAATHEPKVTRVTKPSQCWAVEFSIVMELHPLPLG